MGVPAIRERVAKFISERDGHPCSPDHIYLSSGASAGVSNFLQILLGGANDGVLIPIPQYPLYTAALALNNARAVPYYLDEAKDWTLSVDNLRQQVNDARSNGTQVKAMVVINPGNPTGQCLSPENMREIAQFCYDESLVLCADEVYQDNIYIRGRPFTSFKKVVKDMSGPVADNLELISLHSISKGQTGECGRRGGYYELCNIAPDAEAQFYKLASIQLCPPLHGQIAVDCLVDPPREGSPSYDKWVSERSDIAETLRFRAETLEKSFNALDGVECREAQGAMYLFPTIKLPQGAIDAAKEAKVAPDAFYARRLLEATGICVVPGSGFGQVPGTYHFRTTFLAPGVQDYVERFKKFHDEFMAEYS